VFCPYLTVLALVAVRKMVPTSGAHIGGLCGSGVSAALSMALRVRQWFASSPGERCRGGVARAPASATAKRGSRFAVSETRTRTRMHRRGRSGDCSRRHACRDMIPDWISLPVIRMRAKGTRFEFLFAMA
jgi:hypothetical protein